MTALPPIVPDVCRPPARATRAVRLPLIRAVAAVALIAVPAGGAQLSDAPDTGWMLDGPVYDLATGPDGTVYVAGDFLRALPRTGPFAVLAPAALDARTGPELLGSVDAIASDRAGGWYAGGSFTVAGRPDLRNLVHVRQDGSLDAWRPNPDGRVRALAVDDRSVYAGGEFLRVGTPEALRSRLAAIDRATGAIRADFDPGPNGPVRALLLDGTSLYVGGAFTTLGGQARGRIGAVGTVGGTTLPWPAAADGPVNAIARTGGAVILGGEFAAVAGQARSRLAALTPAGILTTWNPGAAGAVNALAVDPSGDIVVGGRFAFLAGQPRTDLGAVDAVTGQATPWNPAIVDPTAGGVSALTIAGGKVIAGGGFSGAAAPGSASARRWLAGIDPVSGIAGAWPPIPTDAVSALAAAPDGTLAVGGAFGGIGGVERHRLAAFEPLGGAPTAWNPDADGTVRAVAVGGGAVYVGGSMTTVGGQPRAGLAALAPSGQVLPWRADTDGEVRDLAVIGGSVVAGGTFRRVGSAARTRLAAVSAQTGAVTAWDPAPNGDVAALAAGPGAASAIVGGSFTTIGQATAATRPGLAAVDLDTGRATAWTPSILTGPGGVSALFAAGPAAYVAGGQFTRAGGGPGNLLALDAATGAPDAWAPAPDGPVLGIASLGGIRYVGGGFAAAGSGALRGPHSGLAGFDESSGSIIPWQPAVGTGTVTALATSGQSLWAGGTFATVGGRSARALVSFTPAPVATTPPVVGGAPLVGAPLTCRPGTWDWVTGRRYEWLRGGAVLAAGATYTPGAQDRPGPLACRETAVNRGGESSSTSAPTAIVGSLPAVSGRARVGSRVVCVTDPDGLPVAWLRSTRQAPIGSGPSYRVSWDDSGRRLACRVQISGAGGPEFASSALTAKVSPNFGVPDLRIIRRPKVLRLKSALVVFPGVIPRRSKARPRLLGVHLQTTRPGTVRIQIGGGFQAVRFRTAGRASVQVRAGAAFYPPLRSLPVTLTVIGQGKTRTKRSSIRLR